MSTTTSSDDAVWYYKQGLSCKDIAPMFRVSESTVKRWVRAAGVMRAANQGRPLSDTCKRNHDLSEWRRRDKSGNPYCLLCKRERERNRAKEKTMAKKQKTGKPGTFIEPPKPAGPNACPICGATPACTPPKHKGK